MRDRKVDKRQPGKGNSNSMAQGRSTETISMIKWICTSRLSIRISLSLQELQDMAFSDSGSDNDDDDDAGGAPA